MQSEPDEVGAPQMSPHVGNKGLNGKYTVPVELVSASPAPRRDYRVRGWADAVVQAITSEQGV
jgi:hypothetical protein